MLRKYISVIFILAQGCGSLEQAETKARVKSSWSGGESSSGGSVGGYSCEEQASWGKCSESWMHPVCSYACGGQADNQTYWYLAPVAAQPQAESQTQPTQPAGRGISTLPPPYDNNGLMIPNMEAPYLWANNTGLIYNNVGAGGSYPYTNSTTNGVMGDGTGLVTPNWQGGYAYSPYWEGKRSPF